MRGIVLLCVADAEHKFYGDWAHNMALSIRAHSSLPIQVITDGTALERLPCENKVYDIVTEIDFDDWHDGGLVSIAKAKLNVYKYAAFDEYIYLDVDGLVLKDLEPLFDLEGYFQIQVNGVTTKDKDNEDASLWVKNTIIWEHYNLPDDAILAGTNSSFHLCRKGKEADKFWAEAKKAFENPIPVNLHRYKWGKSGQQPDELYTNVALAKVGLVPDMKPVLYIRRRDMGGKNLGLEDIQKDYYVLCCYGGLEYNHHTISGTGDRTSGLYNKLNILNYQKIYGDIKYSLHFYKLISQKVYVKPVK